MSSRVIGKTSSGPLVLNDGGGGSRRLAMDRLDMHFPTTDRRTLVLTRYTEPNADQKLLMRQLKLELPPRIITAPPAIHHPAPAL